MAQLLDVLDDVTLPIHHFTGLRAVGIVNGRPVWPIKGGDGTGDGGSGDGGDGGTGGGNGNGAGQGGNSGEGGKQYTPPASADEMQRIIDNAVARAHGKYGMTPDEAKALKDRVEKLDYDLGTEKDKAVADAAKAAREAAIAEALPDVIQAKLDAAAARAGVSAEDLEKAMEFVDNTKFLNAEGRVDADKVKTFVESIKPAKGNNGGGRPPVNLGQGKQPPAAARPGDAARSWLEKQGIKVG